MTRTAKRSRRLWDAYCFPGFRPEPTVCGVFGDPKARVIRLSRRSKKRLAAVAVASRWGGTIARCGVCAICRVATRLAGQEEERAHSAHRDGHVEAVSAGDGGACAAGCDFVRQVPYHAASG